MFQLRSKLRRDLLVYYFTNPAASHYLRELARILNADPANLSRELASLEDQGVFLSQTRGRQKYFQLNRSYPLFAEYRRILQKTVGVHSRLRDALAGMQGIEQAYLYGSFARDQADLQSDIDLLIIGRPGAEALEAVIARLESKLGREINYTVFDRKEFQKRRAKKDPFLADVWEHEKIALLSTP